MLSRFFIRRTELGHRGDSIVEVLIALGIVSLVLTSAYALVTRNTAASQANQEQSTALKLVERQTEQLLASDAGFATSGCFSPDGGYVTLPSTTCSVNASGDKYDTTTDGGAQYDLTIAKGATGTSAEGMYTVNARWETLSGKSANVSMYVRRAD